jgi:hypothetical protein
MPKHIEDKFKDQYGADKGEAIFHATANAQGRSHKTFKKESNMQLDELEKEFDEEMAGLLNGKGPFENQIPTSTPVDASAPAPVATADVVISGDIAPTGAPMTTPAPSPTPAPGLPEVVPGAVVPPAATHITPEAPMAPPIAEVPPLAPEVPVVPEVGATPIAPIVPPIGEKPIETEAPPEGGPLMEKKKKEGAPKVAQGSPKNDGSSTTKPSKQVHADKKDREEGRKPKHKPDWKKFDESVNLYIAKTSRTSDIGVNTLEKMWNECVEEQSKGEYARSSRKFWLEVKSKFDRKVNNIFLQEAKKKMTERQKLSVAIEGFLENVAKDKYVEAKANVKEMVNSCVNSMISDRKVQYQKALAEEIAKKVREG